MKLTRFYYQFLILIFLSALISSCSGWKDFTTYFNTFYNADRLMIESEDEFSFYEEKITRTKPRVIISNPKKYEPNPFIAGAPPFLEEFIVKQQKRQAVAVKLDSVIIKGSKILANNPKSKYIEETLFMMAKSYFYREEWLNSEVKCSELIDRFPAGEFSPDAHLLFAKSLLIERKFYSGKILLSRTVDICWMLKRYDILSEAFRIQAELSLFENDVEGALRPYKQAIAQTDNDELKARWQVDLASLLYRIGLFDRAEKAFAKVSDYKPDYLGIFEANYLRAASLNRLGQYEKATILLENLENDGKFKEWRGAVFAEKLQQLRLKHDKKGMDSLEKYVDTAYVNNLALGIYHYEKAMDSYDSSDYAGALKYFGKARMQKTVILQSASNMYKLLSEHQQKTSAVASEISKVAAGGKITDTTRVYTAINLFELGRIHEQLDNHDSVVYYYSKASEFCPEKNPERSRYLYGYQRLIKEKDPYLADSLIEYIAMNYPRTEFGKAAIKEVGFTDVFFIDTVADLFESGNQLRISKNYPFSISQYCRIFREFPNHNLAPKSLYSVGFLFENNLKQYDSALFYYRLLIEKYPKSPFAIDIMPSVEFLTATLDGKPIPEHLQPKKYKAKEEINPMIPNEQLPTLPNNSNQNNNSMSPFDLISNPNKMMDQIKSQSQQLLNKPKDMFNGVVDSINTIKLPSMKDFDEIKKKLTPDSTKSNQNINSSDSTKVKK